MLKPLNALAAIGLLVLSACAGATTGTSATSPEVKVLDVAKADQAQVTARGTFVGESDHITTGHAAIGRVGQQWVVILEDDFTFDGAPDPRVALGSNGYDKDTNLSLLASNNGKQVYAIPAALNVANFDEVWIWCKKFNVPLGKARLSLI